MPNKKAEEFREQAERCRRLARETTNREVAQKLSELALEFEEKAAAEDARNPCDR
jgi:hypothetical protein